MTVSVLSSVAANATNDNVRLDALRTMPQLLEQKNYQPELKPLLVRSISSLIPSLTEVDVLRKQLMLDIQTLVEADESYRKLLLPNYQLWAGTGVLSITKLEELPIKNKSASSFR